MFPRFKDLYQTNKEDILTKSAQALYSINKDYLEKKSKIKNSNIKGGVSGTKEDLMFMQNYEHQQTVNDLEKSKQEALQEAQSKYIESLKKEKKGINFGNILDFIKKSV